MRTRADALTEGGQTVMHWLAVGRTSTQIGACIGRSETMVRNRFTRVCDKLDVANRVEAVAPHMRKQYGRGA
jgi:DNA-binding CsgD family transcriptional regulator